MFKVGDIIDYSFYNEVKIIDIDELHYILADKQGNKKSVYIELVDKYGKLKTLER